MSIFSYETAFKQHCGVFLGKKNLSSMIRGLVMGRNELKPFTPCALQDFGRIRQMWWDDKSMNEKNDSKDGNKMEKQHSVALNGRPP